jgi:lipoprotein-anchoring transpeptidase ErfK/SrfK
MAAQVANVQNAELQGGGTIEAAQTFLEPGHFVWKPDPSASGPVKVVVSLPLQVAYVFKGRILIGTSSVSTGLPGYDTPTGAFPILAKDVDHRSSLYEDAPMPYMQRLTWDGVALHGGKVTGQPASHGCVRLPLAFAKKLYAETSLGAEVVIIDEAPLSSEEAFAARPPSDQYAYSQ